MEVYKNVLCGCAEDVRHALTASSHVEKVDILKYVFDEGRIYFSLDASKLPSDEITDFLLHTAIDVYDALDRTKSRIFHIAIRYRKYDVVHALLTKGVDTTMGATYESPGTIAWLYPIRVAFKTKDVRMITLLLAYGVRLSTSSEGIKFYERCPIELLKIDLAMARSIGGADITYAIEVIYNRRSAYERMLLFIAVDSDMKNRVIGPHHVALSITWKTHDLTRLLHTYLNVRRYFEQSHPHTRIRLRDGDITIDESGHSFDLPSLRDTSSLTMRVDEIREELLFIRTSLRDLRLNEGWRTIEDNPLHPLIQKIIDSES